MKIQWSSMHGSGAAGACTVEIYPGGEPRVSDFAHREEVDVVMMRPKSMLELMGGLFFLDAMEERGHRPPELILPFVPGARQDRMNDAGDFLFTAKSVAREINLRNLPKVTVLDPHSEVISGLIDRCHVIHAHECFEHFTPKPYAAVISPDAGAEKRAAAVAKRLGVPLLHGWKTRSVSDGRITGFGLEPTSYASPARVLVVDDICDGGGTFVGLAAVLDDRHLRADLYVTHGIFSLGTKVLLRHYGNIYCTDSIPQTDPGVHVIPVCERLLEGR